MFPLHTIGAPGQVDSCPFSLNKNALIISDYSHENTAQINQRSCNYLKRYRKQS